MIQNPFKFVAALCMLMGSVIPLVSSLVIPGASTPVFYLVSSSSSDPAANLLVRDYPLFNIYCNIVSVASTINRGCWGIFNTHWNRTYRGILFLPRPLRRYGFAPKYSRSSIDRSTRNWCGVYLLRSTRFLNQQFRLLCSIQFVRNPIRY